jgi:hypothetical protein
MWPRIVHKVMVPILAPILPHYTDSNNDRLPHSPSVTTYIRLQFILSAMLIDLNTVAHEGDGDESAMLLDLNIVLGEGSEEVLLDLNQELADDGEDEIQYLQEDQFHLINEEVHPLIGQSHYL